MSSATVQNPHFEYIGKTTRMNTFFVEYGKDGHRINGIEIHSETIDVLWKAADVLDAVGKHRNVTKYIKGTDRIPYNGVCYIRVQICESLGIDIDKLKEEYNRGKTFDRYVVE
jgi:hypothetical protein